MKKFIFVALGFFLILSCEEDDVCIGEGTPHLTVVFRNAFNTENLKDSLTIVSSATPDFQLTDTLYNHQLLDSIKLPLGGLAEEVSYFKIQRRNLEPDVLTVHYLTKTNYVSKACGFRITYENLSYTTTYTNIGNLQPSESNILDSEASTNLYIVYSN